MSEMDIVELEKCLIDSDSALGDDLSSSNVLDGSTTSQRELECLMCKKGFDTSATNCDVIMSLCSECKISVSFPTPGVKRKSVEPPTDAPGTIIQPENKSLEEEDEDEEDEEEASRKEDPDFGPDPDDDSGVLITDDILPEDSELDLRANPIENYTGLESGAEIGDHLKAAVLAQQPFTVVVGKFGPLQFNQNRDPKDFYVQAKQGLFKLTIDPHLSFRLAHFNNDKGKLVLYGYDIFDALLFGDVGLLCLSMIMQKDGLPSGYILFKIGRTRCDRPRIDGFLYHVRENQFYNKHNLKDFMKTMWTRPAYEFDAQKAFEAWEAYLDTNRLEYNPERTIHRNSKHPQRADPPRRSKAPENNEAEVFTDRSRSKRVTTPKPPALASRKQPGRHGPSQTESEDNGDNSDDAEETSGDTDDVDTDAPGKRAKFNKKSDVVLKRQLTSALKANEAYKKGVAAQKEVAKQLKDQLKELKKVADLAVKEAQKAEEKALKAATKLAEEKFAAIRLDAKEESINNLNNDEEDVQLAQPANMQRQIKGVKRGGRVEQQAPPTPVEPQQPVLQQPVPQQPLADGGMPVQHLQQFYCPAQQCYFYFVNGTLVPVPNGSRQPPQPTHPPKPPVVQQHDVGLPILQQYQPGPVPYSNVMAYLSTIDQAKIDHANRLADQANRMALLFPNFPYR